MIPRPAMTPAAVLILALLAAVAINPVVMMLSVLTDALCSVFIVYALFQLNKSCKESHFIGYMVVLTLLVLMTLVSTPFYMMSALLDGAMAIGVLITMIPIMQDIRKA